MNFITDFFKDFMSGFIIANIQSMLENMNTQAANVGAEVAMSPSAWNPSIWGMIQQVAKVAITPIAALILTAVMCMELVSWINEQNRFHTPSDVIAQMVKFVLKLGIGVLLVQKAQALTMMAFDMSAFAIGKAVGVVVISPGSLTVSLAALETTLKAASLGSLMATAVVSIFGNIGIFIISLVVRLIVTGRMIEIYIYCSVGSMPYATLTNKELSGMGKNYINNLLALAFQGFFIFLMLGIYTVMVNQAIKNMATGSSPDVLALITEMLLVSCTLVLMLFRSKSIAKSIFNSH